MLTLQQTLADATRSLHMRIEDNPFMQALHHNEPLESPYRWLLEKLYAFALKGEEKLLALIPETEGFEIEKRLRADLLENDLLALGITSKTSDPSLFDAIDTMGKAIGLLYVMEGSRKGGSYLSAILSSSQTPLPMRYLLGYAQETDSEWKEFCVLLQRYGNTPLQEEIIFGALSAFETLERIFHDA